MFALSYSVNLSKRKVLHTPLRLMSSLRRMSPEEFGKILSGDIPGQFQIVDVREPEELNLARVRSKCHTIHNYPLSEANSWSQNIILGKDTNLKPEVPTICLVRIILHVDSCLDVSIVPSWHAFSASGQFSCW